MERKTNIGGYRTWKLVERVAENIEDIISDHCDVLVALIDEEELSVDVRPYESGPQII